MKNIDLPTDKTEYVLDRLKECINEVINILYRHPKFYLYDRDSFPEIHNLKRELDILLTGDNREIKKMTEEEEILPKDKQEIKDLLKNIDSYMDAIANILHKYPTMLCPTDDCFDIPSYYIERSVDIGSCFNDALNSTLDSINNCYKEKICGIQKAIRRQKLILELNQSLEKEFYCKFQYDTNSFLIKHLIENG